MVGATLAIAGGRKNKVRPGDILGALTRPGGIEGKAVGNISVRGPRRLCRHRARACENRPETASDWEDKGPQVQGAQATGIETAGRNIGLKLEEGK